MSLAVGMLVGVIYAVVNVRSPAPPVLALIGLLGMLLGEHAVPIAQRLAAQDSLSLPWRSTARVPTDVSARAIEPSQDAQQQRDI